MRSISISGLLKRGWIPLLLVVVLAVSGLVVSRLHKVFASQDLNANAGAGIEIVQFNPKIVVYDVYGPPGSTAKISYFDPDANMHRSTRAAAVVDHHCRRRCRRSAPASWRRPTATRSDAASP